MAAKVTGESSAAFEDLVRDALIHLYDTAYLQTHSLAQMLAAKQAPGATLRGKLLLQALLDAIETLHPPPGTPAESPAWRSHRILELRYVEGLCARDTVSQLAISKTQYQRDHARALGAVALALQDQLQFETDDVPALPGPSPRQSLALTEAAWLAGQLNPEQIDLADLLGSLFTLLRPVSEESAVPLSLHVDVDVPAVYADRVALRQIFLALLNTALGLGHDQGVTVSLTGQGQSVVASVTVPRTRDVAARADRAEPELEVVKQLTGAAGGQFEAEAGGPGAAWTARLRLPLARRSRLLVVDNHPDFINLISRYLAEHEWIVVGTPDVERAQSLALELLPDAILLDVMMPGRDGWDLLLGLRSRPETGQIPVIVCSVLYEPQVARALGAADYLAKPVSQLELLAALNRLPRGASGTARAC